MNYREIITKCWKLDMDIPLISVPLLSVSRQAAREATLTVVAAATDLCVNKTDYSLETVGLISQSHHLDTATITGHLQP